MSMRVMIVGAGVTGVKHARTVTAAGDAVTVVVDPVLERAEALAPSAEAVSSVDEAIAADLADAAVVATPSHTHLDDVTALVRSGMPVLVEKPHRLPGQHASDLLALDAAAGGIVFVGMSTRHWPGVEAVTEAAHSGRLGDIVSYRDATGFRLDPDSLPDWYFDPVYAGGGVALTNGVHALDRARAIAGPLALTRARLDTVFPTHVCEDVAHIEADASGVPVVLDIAWLPYSPMEQALTVVGTAGQARVTMDGAWEIRGLKDAQRGEPIDIDTVSFARQWQAFRERTSGFGLNDLEPTLTLIEQIYEEAGRA